jgi:hypothetical protein
VSTTIQSPHLSRRESSVEMQNVPHRREWILHYPEGAHLLLFPDHCRRIDVYEGVAEILVDPTIAVTLPAPTVNALAEEVSNLLRLTIENRLSTVTKHIDHILSIDPRAVIISDVEMIREYIPGFNWDEDTIGEYARSNDYAVAIDDTTLDSIVQASMEYRLNAEAVLLEIVHDSRPGSGVDRSRLAQAHSQAIYIVTERGHRVDVISIDLNPNFILP